MNLGFFRTIRCQNVNPMQIRGKNRQLQQGVAVKMVSTMGKKTEANSTSQLTRNEAPRSKAPRYLCEILRSPSTLLRQGYGGFSSPSSSQQAARYSAKENNKFKISHSALGYIGGIIPPTPTVMRVAVRVPSSLCTAGMKTPVPALSKERSADTFFTIGVPGGINTFCCPPL